MEKEHLRAFLKSKGLTQKDFADMLGVTPATVSGYFTRGVPKYVPLVVRLIVENDNLKDENYDLRNKLIENYL